MDTGNSFKRTKTSCLSNQSMGHSTNSRRGTFCFGSQPTTLLTVTVMLSVAFCQQLVASDRVVQNLNQAASNKNLDQMATTGTGTTNSQMHDLVGRDGSQNGALDLAELNSIVQQHDALDGNNKLLAEAIIARLMVDNLTTGSNLLSGINELENEISTPSEQQLLLQQQQQFPNTGETSPFGGLSQQEQVSGGGNEQQTMGANGLEAARLRKLMSVLHNYEASLGGTGAGLGIALAPYPILPSSQAATMKRAAMKMGNYLQQQQRQSASPSYARNNFDFGLGKRPDSTISGNILRFGDGPIGGQIQPASQFGKRPSSHRYDFGLGKRVASPAYPRYDFGLGKRAPNRIRYDFGLGK